MLTGPYDISAMTGTDALGSSRIQATAIPARQRAIFAERIVDGARTATAGLMFTLGEQVVEVQRRLKDLRLVGFKINGTEQTTDEANYQTKIADLVGVWSFGDWILLLRHIIFYFEDRRALVWDPTAQRQLLRFLFLPKELARRWTEDERKILELDSRVRNFSAVLYREEQSIEEAEAKMEKAADITAKIQSLNESQQVDLERRAELDKGVSDLESRRQEARLRVMKAEQEREDRYRELERAKLMAIEARFPDRTESARYILAQLMSSSECLFCGNTVPIVAKQLETRISTHQCVVCGSNLDGEVDSADVACITDKQIAEYIAALQAIEPDLSEAKRSLQEREAEHEAFLKERTELEGSITKRSALIDALAEQLPPEKKELIKQRDDLAALRGKEEIMKAELAAKRSAFKKFIREQSHSLVVKAADIQSCFNRHAKEFLFDDCGLTWAPQRTSLGQGGETIDFPNFQVELGGTDFPSPVRRSGPEQVSESQREFIDLAFRMALTEVAARGSVGSLIIDAPESSLDAIFSKRAAAVLARFAQPAKGNRLIITSNLVEGTLIPTLLALAGPNMEDRTIDLFRVAAPTKATTELQTEYAEKMAQIRTAAASNSPGGSEASQ
jgi:hypothetical protein